MAQAGAGSIGAASGMGQRQLLELAATRLLAAGSVATGQPGDSTTATGSNYDFIKVKVRLGNDLEHYYILSRFLLSRMLTVITLPQHKAVRIALDVKKHLVDHDRLDITQEELEEVLFAQLRQRGFGDDYVRRYQMVTRFFQQKRPLIILVAGSACTGKSSLAQQLASRLNLPNVLQTDVLCELLRASGTGDLPAEPLWRRPLPAGTSLVGEFQRECGIIRRALDGDLCKCIRDGKSIIIEGLHIDPGLFLREFGDPRGEPVLMQPAGSLDCFDAAEAVVARGAAQAAAAAGQLADLQVAEAKGEVPAAGEAVAGAAELDDAPSAAAAAPVPGGGQALQPSQQQQQQQAGVRRTASFGDAVSRLSHASVRRDQSPWKDAASSKPLMRPRSARVGDSPGGLEQRGQAVFMLQLPDTAGSSAGSAGAESPSAAAPTPVPSPRLAACISLPTVLEHSQEGRQPRRQLHRSGLSCPLPPAEEAGSGSGDGCLAPGAAAGEDEDMGMPLLDLNQAAGSCQWADTAACAAVPAEQPPTEGTARDRPPLPAQAQQAQQQQQQHNSVAAADAAATAAAGTGPVFVPICLAVPDEEYEGMLQDWLDLQQRAMGPSSSSSCEAGDGGGGVSAAEASARLRSLQAHLRRYAPAGVPVVELNMSDMGRALDRMHSYVLQCIALAMGLQEYG